MEAAVEPAPHPGENPWARQNRFGASVIQLGALGRAFLAAGPPCGAPTPNCVLTLYAMRDGRLRDVMDGGGIDAVVVPDGEPVPEVATRWNFGASVFAVTVYRWNGTGFQPAVCESETTTGDSTDPRNRIFKHARVCGNGAPTQAVRLPAFKRADSGGVALDPAAYTRIRALLRGRVGAAAWKATHAVAAGQQGSLFVAAKTGQCDRRGNCRIFILQQLDDSYLLAVDGVAGWGVAQVSPPAADPDAVDALVIASHRAHGADAYRLYLNAPNFQPHLSDWRLAACEAGVPGRLRAMPCAAPQASPKTPQRR